jgi:hypothetical protein
MAVITSDQEQSAFQAQINAYGRFLKGSASANDSVAGQHNGPLFLN